MVDWNKVPLFPLQAVLFPGISIPLHIFEPRYREMVETCVKRNSPFGIVLIEEGSEVGPEAAPTISAVGCLARIVRSEPLEDGRSFIEVTGETRFIIRATSDDEPYLTGQLIPVDDEPSDPAQIDPLYDLVAINFRTYITQLLARMDRTVSAIQLPDDPTALSFAVAGALDIPLADKQRLLEATTAGERLAMEVEYLAATTAQPEITVTGTESAATITPLDASSLRDLMSRN